MMAMKSKRLLLSVSLSILFFALGCVRTKTKVYVNPNINFRFVKKLAVLPFENLSNDRYADKKVRDIFVTSLLASEVVEVPELGEVLQAINNLGIDAQQDQAAFGEQVQAPFGGQPFGGQVQKPTDTITKDVARALGQALNVQGIILGSVEEYAIIRSSSGSYPEVSLTLRMIDAKTGTIIWAVSHAEKGSRILPSLLGIGEETLTETAIKASKKIVDTLIYK